jgi:hypothetical protein
MRNSLESLIEDRKMSHQGVIAVKIERRPDFLGDLLNGNLLALKLVILVFKKTHRPSPSNAEFPSPLPSPHRGEGGVRGLHSALV